MDPVTAKHIKVALNLIGTAGRGAVVECLAKIGLSAQAASRSAIVLGGQRGLKSREVFVAIAAKLVK